MSIHFLYRHRFTILLSLHHFHLSLSILHPPPKSPYMILLLSSLSTFLSSTYPSPLFSSHVTMSKKKNPFFMCLSLFLHLLSLSHSWSSDVFSHFFTLFGRYSFTSVYHIPDSPVTNISAYFLGLFLLRRCQIMSRKICSLIVMLVYQTSKVADDAFIGDLGMSVIWLTVIHLINQ